jgi:hypothetical protein
MRCQELPVPSSVAFGATFHLRPKSRPSGGWPPKRACGRSPREGIFAWKKFVYFSVRRGMTCHARDQAAISHWVSCYCNFVPPGD